MVRIYIHGRPQGQDIWSNNPNPNDKFYLNPFLDSRIGVEMNAVLQVDIWQQNAYYSYVHRHNIIEKSNRPDAYLAITICFEKQVCTKVAILYELLETVYKQLCIGSLVEQQGEYERFNVAQLKEQEPVLKQIVTVINQNIDKLIASNLTDIDASIISNATTNKSYSLRDVDSPQFISDCLTYRILVSPTFTTKDKLPIELGKQNSDLKTQITSVVKECNDWQTKAEQHAQKIETLTQQLTSQEKQITQLQENLQTIKDEEQAKYQKRIQMLKDDGKQLQENVQSLQSEKADLQRNMKLCKDEINRLKQSKQAKYEKTFTQSEVETETDSNPNSDPDTENAINEKIVELKNFFRQMAGRFPVLWSKIAALLALTANILIIVFGFLLMGNQKTHNVDILNTDVQTSDSLSAPNDSIGLVKTK